MIAQAQAALQAVPATEPVLVAYEPVWAIGERGTPARPEDVAGVIDALATAIGPERGVLYGGSVDLDNCVELVDVPGVSGLFIGRAAWDVEGFLEIVAAVGASRGIRFT